MPIYNPPVQSGSSGDVNYDGGTATTVGIVITATTIDGGTA